MRSVLLISLLAAGTWTPERQGVLGENLRASLPLENHNDHDSNDAIPPVKKLANRDLGHHDRLQKRHHAQYDVEKTEKYYQYSTEAEAGDDGYGTDNQAHPFFAADDEYEATLYPDGDYAATPHPDDDYSFGHGNDIYLPDYIRPKPFSNCIPEAFALSNRGKEGVKHHYGDGNYNHKKKGGGGDYGDGYSKGSKGKRGEGDYGLYGSKGSKGSKGKSKGGNRKGGEGGSSKSKSKGGNGNYYRQLGARFRHAPPDSSPYYGSPQARTHNGNRRRHSRNGFRGFRRSRNADHAGGESEYQQQGYLNTVGQYRDDKGGFKKGGFKKGGGAKQAKYNHHPPELPLCPPPRPIFEDYGPVPTIAPLGDNATEPTVGAPTASPSPAGSTGGAPVDTPPGTTRILVESFLTYGFFPEAQMRAPTQAEIDGVLAETSRFYTMLLQERFPNLNSFQATLVDTTTDLTMFASGNPVQIDFDANAFFNEGTAVPTPIEVFMVLEAASYEDYIMNFVWMAQPTDGLFSQTQRATYNARVVPARKLIAREQNVSAIPQSMKY